MLSPEFQSEFVRHADLEEEERHQMEAAARILDVPVSTLVTGNTYNTDQLIKLSSLYFESDYGLRTHLAEGPAQTLGIFFFEGHAFLFTDCGVGVFCTMKAANFVMHKLENVHVPG